MKGTLSTVSLGFAFGVAKAVAVLLLAWANARWGAGQNVVQLISGINYSFDPTLQTTLMNTLWGFLGGFIFGIIVGWVYNTCVWLTYAD